MNTTHTNEPIEQKEKQKATPLLDELDLRDYFAAKAMQGELAALCDPQNQICGLSLDTNDEQLARLTKHYYRIADSMLKAREQ
jgi:hypothetical protein